MISQKIVITNPTGLHLRPAGYLCNQAIKFKTPITFTFGDTTANAKSVLSVLGAGVKCGNESNWSVREKMRKKRSGIWWLRSRAAWESRKKIRRGSIPGGILLLGMKKGT